MTCGSSRRASIRRSSRVAASPRPSPPWQPAPRTGRGSRPASIGRYPPEIESTVYFCCLEALQNVAKHAGEAATATVRVWEEAGGLLFEVSDDGAGFDPARAAGGAGLANMTDRLGAIGGSLRIESAPGRGARVAGTIPLRG